MTVVGSGCNSKSKVQMKGVCRSNECNESELSESKEMEKREERKKEKQRRKGGGLRRAATIGWEATCGAKLLLFLDKRLLYVG